MSELRNLKLKKDLHPKAITYVSTSNLLKNKTFDIIIQYIHLLKKVHRLNIILTTYKQTKQEAATIYEKTPNRSNNTLNNRKAVSENICKTESWDIPQFI